MAYVYYDLHGNSIIGWSHYNIQLQVKHAVIHTLVSVLHIMGTGKRGSIFNLSFLPDEKKTRNGSTLTAIKIKPRRKIAYAYGCNHQFQKKS